MSIKYLDGTNPSHPEAKRLVSWYGERITHFGGGNESGRKPDQNFLWKPKADNGGNLVVLTPSGLRVDSVRVGIEKAVNMSIGNGWRPHWRFSRPGSAYGSSVQVVLSLTGGGAHVVTVPNGGARYQTASLPKGSTTTHTPSQPAPAPVPSVPPPSAAITFPSSWIPWIESVFVVQGVRAKDGMPTAPPIQCRRLNANSFGTGWGLATYAQPAYYAVDVVDAVERFLPQSVKGWTYFDAKGEFVSFGAKPLPVPPPAIALPPAPAPTPAPAKDATLTATGLRLAPDLVPLVAKVLVLTHAETPSKTVKHFASFQGGGEWSTGQPLSAYPAAVFQIFWLQEPPARIPHHQGFPGAIKNVSHVMPDGRWNPHSTRNP